MTESKTLGRGRGIVARLTTRKRRGCDDTRNGPTVEDVNAAIAGDLIAYQMNAWDEGMCAHSEGKGSDANPYRAWLDAHPHAND